MCIGVGWGSKGLQSHVAWFARMGPFVKSPETRVRSVAVYLGARAGAGAGPALSEPELAGLGLFQAMPAGAACAAGAAGQTEVKPKLKPPRP